MPVHHVLPGLALVGGAVVALLASLWIPHRRQWVGALVALGAIGAALAAAARLQATVPAQLSFSGDWALDRITAAATFAIGGATALTVPLVPAWLRTDRRHGEHYAVLLFGAVGALVLAGAADAMELVVGMLLVSVTGYTLASYHRRSRASAEAGAKYFFLGALTNPLLFLGAVLLYGATGTTGYLGAAEAMAAGADPVAVAAAVALLVLGVAFELGAVPVHFWVPDVAQGSPAPSAAFLTVVPKIGALVALARLASIVPEAVGWRPLVAVMAAATMSLGNLAALWQEDVRRLIGWSSVSQAGYGLMAVVALGRSPFAWPSLALFVVAYALANVAAFAVVVALRGRTARADYRGLARRRPWHAAALTLAFLSLIGIPPLVGFTAKLQLFGATLDAGYGWLAALAVLNTVVSVFYYLRVLGPVYFAAPEGEVAVLGRASSAVALSSAGAVVIGGLAAELVLGGMAGAVALPTLPASG